MITSDLCLKRRISKLPWKDLHYIDYKEMAFMMSMKALSYIVQWQKKDSFPLKSLVTDTVCSRPVERCEAGEPRHLLAQLLPARGQVRTNNNGLLGTTSNIKLDFGFHLIPFYNCNSVRECEV